MINAFLNAGPAIIVTFMVIWILALHGRQDA